MGAIRWLAAVLAAAAVSGAVAPAAAPLFAARFLWYDTGLQPLALVAVDLNADRRVDLVIANAASHTVSVLL